MQWRGSFKKFRQNFFEKLTFLHDTAVVCVVLPNYLDIEDIDLKLLKRLPYWLLSQN